MKLTTVKFRHYLVIFFTCLIRSYLYLHWGWRRIKECLWSLYMVQPPVTATNLHFDRWLRPTYTLGTLVHPPWYSHEVLGGRWNILCRDSVYVWREQIEEWHSNHGVVRIGTEGSLPQTDSLDKHSSCRLVKLRPSGVFRLNWILVCR